MLKHDRENDDLRAVDPSPNVRLDVFREFQDWDDLHELVSANYRMYSSLESKLSPYNTRMRNSGRDYVPPSKEYIRMALGRKLNAIPDILYENVLEATASFYQKHKGHKQLPLPHPVTHHSAHFPAGTFLIETYAVEKWMTNSIKKNRSVSSVHAITLAGAKEPIYVENLRDDVYKYLIVRPKLSKLGTPMAGSWEILFYKNNFRYMIDHIDAQINPRFAGVVPNSRGK